MYKTGLIGYTGFLGSIIRNFYDFDALYSSNNITSIENVEHGLVICAAPTSSRIAVSKNPYADLCSVQQLIQSVSKSKINHFVLISTIDAIKFPEHSYGSNRKFLEDSIKTICKSYSIIRLPMLIHPLIKKNILFDLKNNVFLENINLNSEYQYYNLSNLKTDLDYVISNNLTEANLFSEPISTRDIVDRFFSSLKISQQKSNPTIYNCTPYRYDKTCIFDALEKYFL